MPPRQPVSNEAVARVAWSEFIAGLDWRQGEHVALVGPTGSGKTYLANELLPRRRFVAVLATKARDRSLDQLRKVNGYKRITEWPPPAPPEQMPRVLVWPHLRRPEDVATQARVFAATLGGVFASGGWCLYLDELRYVTETLHLQRAVELLWLQGRSLGVSLVTGTQRPAFVPLVMYDQSTHLFFWRDNDERNLKRLSGIGWLSANLIRDTVAHLARHDVLYINTRTGNMLVTRAERQ